MFFVKTLFLGSPFQLIFNFWALPYCLAPGDDLFVRLAANPRRGKGVAGPKSDCSTFES